jgi:glycosyltransferase involved in cell wall biosynthesis
MLRHLKRKFHISYACPITDSDLPESYQNADEYCDRFTGFPHHFPKRGGVEFALRALWNSLTGSLPYMARKYVSPSFTTWLDKEASGSTYNLIVCDYLVSFVHIQTLLHHPRAPVVVFQHNVESLIWQRHAASSRHPLKKWVFKREATLALRMEESCGKVADGQITVSPDETHYFRNVRKMVNTLGDVPTGVDAAFFAPASEPEPYTLAFLGSMDWEANRQAVREFMASSLPLIMAQFPQTRFLIIGRNPPQDLVEAAERDPSLIVTGTVDDVRPFLARASIMVLPLKVGGGTRIKVYEAMAAGLAIVSTSIGVEGLPVVSGEHLVIAEGGKATTDAVIELFRNPENRRKIAATGRQFVEQHCSWESAATQFERLCVPLLAPKGS